MASIHSKIESNINNEPDPDFDIRDMSRDFNNLLEQAELLNVKVHNMDTYQDNQANTEMSINYKQRKKSIINNNSDDEDL